ncbi:MAG TPA: arsenate reductase family protein [Thermomicrobiales bacterium]|nr:arsenate reductase family protein [Thermomicrobiales bacterium]
MITAYVYNSCTSCRKTDEVLKQSGVPYARREFFKERFTRDELAQVLEGAGLTASNVLSRRSRVYKERDLEHADLTDDQLLNLMVEEPTLLRRPLVLDGEQVIVGHNEPALREMIERAQTA